MVQQGWTMFLSTIKDGGYAPFSNLHTLPTRSYQTIIQYASNVRLHFLHAFCQWHQRVPTSKWMHIFSMTPNNSYFKADAHSINDTKQFLLQSGCIGASNPRGHCIGEGLVHGLGNWSKSELPFSPCQQMFVSLPQNDSKSTTQAWWADQRPQETSLGSQN